MNKVELMGWLTSPPIMSMTSTGLNVASFILAVHRRNKNADSNYDTDFIRCVAWRQKAEFVSKHFKKGQMMAVVGSLKTTSFEKDGQKHFVSNVVVSEVYFCGSGKGEKTSNDASAPEQESGNNISEFGPLPLPDNDDDLPF